MYAHKCVPAECVFDDVSGLLSYSRRELYRLQNSNKKLNMYSVKWCKKLVKKLIVFVKSFYLCDYIAKRSKYVLPSKRILSYRKLCDQIRWISNEVSCFAQSLLLASSSFICLCYILECYKHICKTNFKIITNIR